MADMSTADINDLPDSDFAYIEPGGEKDDEGKTKPRSLRHYPIQDAAHVRNALARANAAINEGGDAATIAKHALPRIEAKAKALGIGQEGDGKAVDLPFLFAPGSKAVITADGQATGMLAPYGGPLKGGYDLQGERFTKDTDFGLDWYPTIPILYGHGSNKDTNPAEVGGIGVEKVGSITVKEIRDRGLWVQGELDKQSQYYDVLRELAEKGDLYWSSGTAPHLRRYAADGKTISTWPVAEATLTVTPANPFAGASVKAVEPVPAAKAGARNSAADAAHIQTIHDHAMALGATCPDGDDAGKALDTPPAPDLASAGEVAAPVTVVNLEDVAVRLMKLIDEAAADGVKPFFG